MKPSGVRRVLRVACCLLGVLGAHATRAQESTNGFAFADFLLVPLRVHLLTATNEPAIHTTLTSNDVTRILGKVNRVWAQAGITFYLESLRVEAATNPTNYVENAREDERATLLSLRPKDSLATNCFHVFYLRQIRANGIYFNAQGIFVKDTASLRKVEGGIDEPLPRVTSHELGHALTLPHRQDVTNLLASGTTGTWFNEAEIKQAREAAKKKEWIQPAPDVLRKAHEPHHANEADEPRKLWLRISHIPLECDPTRLARERVEELAK